MSGRVNAALNLLHVGGAFALQSATGLVIGQWPDTNGVYPADAHQTAVAANLLLQLAALAWLAVPPRREAVLTMASLAGRSLAVKSPATASPPYGWAALPRPLEAIYLARSVKGPPWSTAHLRPLHIASELTETSSPAMLASSMRRKR